MYGTLSFFDQIILPVTSNKVILILLSLPPTQSLDSLLAGLGLNSMSSEIKIVSSYTPWHLKFVDTLIVLNPALRSRLILFSDVLIRLPFSNIS